VTNIVYENLVAGLCLGIACWLILTVAIIKGIFDLMEILR
jgi:hypothetical protein